MSEIRKCPRCGASASGKFCTRCGLNMEEIQEPVQEIVVTEEILESQPVQPAPTQSQPAAQPHVESVQPQPASTQQASQYQQPDGSSQNHSGSHIDYNQDPQSRTRESEWINQKTAVLVSGARNMFSEIGPLFKSPITRLKEINMSGSMAVGAEFIIAKCVVVLILLGILLMKLSSTINSYFGSYYSVDIPVFQILLMGVILTAGLDFLEAFVMKLITGAFNGVSSLAQMVNIEGLKAMYDTFLLILVVLLALIAPEVALVIGSVGAALPLLMQIAAYCQCIQMNENKKPYALFVIKICSGLLALLVVYLLFRSVLNSAAYWLNFLY